MKRIFSLIAILTVLSNVSAQETKHYLSAAAEINFSNARIVSESGEEGGAITRFAPWFNVQLYHNWDKQSHGFFAGFTLRNIGFIYEKGNEKWKARNYALGIPIGIKFGDMNNMFVYAGYEFEVPIHYKEKYFRNDAKDRVMEIWFSDRVSPFTHAGFVGMNFKYGFNVKLKYYFTEFFNKDFNNSSIDDPRDLRYENTNGAKDPSTGVEYASREFLKVNVFYLALTWNMFRKPVYYIESKEEVKQSSIY